MDNNTGKIVVAGDVSIDWLRLTTPSEVTQGKRQAETANWRLHPRTRMVALPGGSLLLARMVGEATGMSVATHELKNLEIIPTEKTIHSIVQLDGYPYSAAREDKDNLRFRVKHLAGFDGPADGNPDSAPVSPDNPYAEIVILDDAGNGFRDVEKIWPQALLAKDKQPIILLKMSRPITEGKLWKLVRQRHAEQMVVVVSADDLRAEGVNISRRLSWERTAKDLVWQLACNSRISELVYCRHLIVRFGLDGAIYTRRNEDGSESRLYYDPMVAEDGYGDDFPGQMLGFSSAFVAALAARIVEQGFTGVGEGVRNGILSSRRLYREGFGRNAEKLNYPCGEIFGSPTKDDAVLAEVLVPNLFTAESADPDFWCILKDRQEARLENMAYDIAIKGDVETMKGVPVGKFGYLKAVDRAEIESYRSIKNLILEYLHTTKAKRPLSIAVFGPPGSGKSFGVTQVAEGLAPGRIKQIEFNVSQFQSPDDLVKAFHKVRDIVLREKMPLVFFDEFDSALEGELGWLKYFLAPMQDGKFKDGDALHPIGQAIFVFAGGLSESHEAFCNGRAGESEKDVYESRFRAAKGPDFVSRLRGYVNIKGVNAGGDNDQLYMIRRAMILRSMIERLAGHLIEDKTGRARIDPGVLRAMIKVSKYKHGARSMEAILDMSLLAGRDRFEQASLPSTEQLRLHVDAKKFSKLVVRDELPEDAHELLAQAIHWQYREDQKTIKKPQDRAMQPWENLSENLKESNRQQADQIPEKLNKVGCGYTPVVGAKPKHFEFTKDDVEIMAEMEHERFVVERLMSGWSPGPERDDKNKKSPFLVPWDELPEEVKEWDRNAVKSIPKIMASIQFQIYRLDA